MKPIILLILFSVQYLTIPLISSGKTVEAFGAVYYVKQSGGNGDGLSDATAWNLDGLNTKYITPGSTVLFKKGDEFYGTLNPASGNSANPVTYGSYGDGANPIISGLSTITSWTLSGANIYYTTIDVPELNVVTLDGQLKAMGRYPKEGFLIFTGHSGTSAISGPSIGTLPFNSTGGEVVIRKHRQISDRHIITAHSGNTLGLSSAGAHGTVFLNNNNDTPADGNGYFIQAHLKTLTDLGDWYYDKAQKRLYMHFGAGLPSGHIVRASTVRVLSQMDNKTYIIFNNIDFVGANREAINMNNTNSITFSDCNFTKSLSAVGGDNGVSDLVVQGGAMTDILSSAMFIPSLANNITVDGVRMSNIGIIPGAGGSGGGQQLGIWLVGGNLTVKNSVLRNIGYHGIMLYGDNTLVERNLIDTYGLTKDDCGAIYEFQFNNMKSTNKIIRKNIILNGVGNPSGAPAWEQFGQASAIYLDAAVNNVQIYDNVLAHGNWGGLHLIGAGENNKLTNNLVYDFSKGLLLFNYETLKIRNTEITGNTFIAKTTKQYPLYLEMYANDDPSLYGTFNDNIYTRPIDDSSVVGINKIFQGGNGLTEMTLAGWKSAFGLDGNSSKSMTSTDEESNLRFEYNYSDKETRVSLSPLTVYSDVAKTLYTSNIKLPAFGGAVLIKVANIVQTISSGNWTDRSTWSSGNVPGPKEYVIINKGHTVTVEQKIPSKDIHVNVDGNLLFLGDYKVGN